MILLATYTMFKLTKPAPTFVGIARITIPGQQTLGEIRMVWRHKTTEQINDWIRRSATAGDDVAVLSEVIEGWAEVVDADGAPRAYSVEALRELLSDYPASGRDLFNSYLKDLTASRLKN